MDKLAIEMTAEEALNVALECLEDRAAETDTASPEGHQTRLAIDMLVAMLKQRGCDHFNVGCNHLTDLIDLIVYG